MDDYSLWWLLMPWWYSTRLSVHTGFMMTSSNGNIYRLTGPLCGEFTGYRWIPLTKATDVELWWCFFFICVWINCWINNRKAGYLRCHCAHYDVIVMRVNIYQVGLISCHCIDVIMSGMASWIISVTIVGLTVCSGADERKHQSFASLAFVRGSHQWTVDFPHKGPLAWEMSPFDDVIMWHIYESTN